MVLFINVFGRNGGFKAIRDELSSDNVSLSRVKELLTPMYLVRDYLTAEFLNWFFVVHQTATRPVLVMSDDDLKNDFKPASDIVNYMCGLFRFCTRSDAAQASELLRLSFALKGFRSPFLERRLVGLTDICNFVEEVHMASQKGGSSKSDADDKPWATPDFLCDWLIKNDILASIFSRNLHVEVVKRSSRILIFLAANRSLNVPELEVIWSASLGKHESIQKNVLEILSASIFYQTPEALLKLLDFLEALKPADYTSHHIALLRYIAFQLATKFSHLKSNRGLAGVDLMWRLIQDDVRFPQSDLHTSCLQYTIEAIDMANTPMLRTFLFAEGIKNLRMHRY